MPFLVPVVKIVSGATPFEPQTVSFFPVRENVHIVGIVRTVTDIINLQIFPFDAENFSLPFFPVDRPFNF